MLLFPRHSECQTQDFLGFGHGLFVHSLGCDRVLLSSIIAHRVLFIFQSLFLRFNYTKAMAWLFSETEIVNSKHVNSEYAICC